MHTPTHSLLAPDSLRRQRNIQIILILFGIVAGILLVFMAGVFLFAPDVFAVEQENFLGTLIPVTLIAITVFVGIWFVNRRSPEAAGVLLVLFTMVAYLFVDTPEEIIAGRSSYVYFIPIMMGGMLIRPIASPIVAVVCCIIMVFFTVANQQIPNVFVMSGYLSVSGLVFLFTNSLEKSLASLRKAKRQAEEASESKSRFLARANHELRTPLTTGRFFAEILTQEDAPEDARSVAADRLPSLLEDMSTMIHSLLLVASGDPAVLDPQPVEVLTFCEEVAKGFQPTVEAKGLELTLKGDRGALMVTDPHLLRMVIHHLLSNAVKFTEEGRIQVTVASQNDSIRITVADTGIGIPVADRDLIWQAFEQGENDPMTRQYAGLGLGLTVVQQATMALNGSVVLESTEGKGTTVALRLPSLVEEPSMALAS